MNIRKHKMTINLRFPEPSTLEEVNKNTREASTFFCQFLHQKYTLDFLVVFLIHKNIEPEFKDYENFEFIRVSDLISGWNFIFEENMLVLIVPQEKFSNSDFTLLEAYFDCDYTEQHAKISIHMSRLRNFRCIKEIKTN